MTSEAFYSQLGRAVADAPDKVFGRAEQVKSWIQANASKLGVKQDEIVWSGVLDWLDLQEGKVSKEQVLGYLDANGVQVEEVMFGELSDNDFISKFKEYGYGIEFEIEGSDKSAFYKNNIGEAVEYSKLPKVLQDYMNRDYSSKYDQKSVPGGSSYKELLLTLPSEPKESLEAYIVRHKDFYKGMDVSDAIIENDWLSNRKIGHEGGSGLYKSTHFATPNILAHVRFDERVNNEGGKTLFIQEIQSDWGQDGKKRGFIERYNPQDVAVLDPGSIEANQPEIFWYFKVPGNVLQIPKSKYTTESEALNYILNEKQTISAASTPLGPFVTETRAWVGLAIKRITRYAAENGFERVAFINGVQAADLFDLSKQVDSVTVAIDGGSPTGKVYRIITMKDGVKQGEWRSLEMDEMPNIIGKDLSEKGIKEGGGTYSGLDLQVGSEGMKVFYNQIVPQVVKGVIKNLGGELSTFINEAKAVIRLSQSEAETLYSEGGGVYYKNIDDDELAVSDDDIEEGDEFFDGYDNFYTYSVFEKQTSQLSFNVTDQMRTKILNEGLPLFSQDIGNYSQGLSIDLIDAEIARFKSEWTAMPDVIVVQSVDSLPFEAPVNADGAYYDGRVYVVANNIVDIKQLQKVMAHECVLHHSLQEMLGDYGFSKLHAGIQGLKAAGDPTVVALAANILGRYGVLPPEVETKEIIARAGSSAWMMRVTCVSGTGL